jgi:glycosyltransferase involved in cell wall biosynthesis
MMRVTVELQKTMAHIPQLVERSNRAMKVVLLTRDLDYGGAQRQLVVLAKGLHAKGHMVVVAPFYSSGPLEQELLETGVRIWPLQKRGRWDLLPFLFRLAQFIRVERPEILYSFLADLVTVLLKPWFPSVKIVWAIRSSNMDLSQYNWLSGVCYNLNYRLSRFADAIIANSRAGRAYYADQGYPWSKIVVIPNGIDTQRFRPDPEARRHIRSEWGIQEHEQVIGIVGRLDPMKDHPTFLRAANLLSQERNHLRFVSVGDGPAEQRDSLHHLARSLNLTENMFWSDGRKDMPAVFNALDLLVSSSTSEGFSNVIAEAMACGVMCVVTNVGDSALLVEDAGEVVPPRDPVALKNTIAQLLNRSLHTPTQIHQSIVKRFSVEKLVADTEHVLLALLQGSCTEVSCAICTARTARPTAL